MTVETLLFWTIIVACVFLVLGLLAIVGVAVIVTRDPSTMQEPKQWHR